MKAIPSVQVENERVIVTKWHFPPGSDTGDHVHAHDYVVVPFTSGKLRLVEPTGIRDVELIVDVFFDCIFCENDFGKMIGCSEFDII